MKKNEMIQLAIFLVLPLAAFGQNWTDEQQEVLAWEEACISGDDFDEFSDCFHNDFVGWGIDYPVPTSKADRLKLLADEFERFEYEVLLFKPLSVFIQGNTAIINYLSSARLTNTDTGEVSLVTSRWTDVAMQDGNTWSWVADHGVSVSPE